MYDTTNTQSILKTDILIIGGGIAGSMVAAMLGRVGIDTLLVDPNERYRPEFRCEKFDKEQLKLLANTGLLPAIEQNTAPISNIWVARFGRLVNRTRYEHFGFTYENVVNSIRDQISGSARFVTGKVTEINNSADRQEVTLSSGEKISARLVIMANGLNLGLRNSLGIERTTISQNHILCAAFDVIRKDTKPFKFDSITYWSERLAARMAYFTIFPADRPNSTSSGKTMRANMFGYWHVKDPAIEKLRTNPEQALYELMPNLRDMIGELDVQPGSLRLRPVELYQSKPKGLSGVVLVGDAYSTSCPGAGTGVTKVLNDVIQLCNIHIPKWLETPGMGAEKLDSFYTDPIKCAADEKSLESAFNLREISLSRKPKWIAQRWLRFGYHSLKGISSALTRRNSKVDFHKSRPNILPGE